MVLVLMGCHRSDPLPPSPHPSPPDPVTAPALSPPSADVDIDSGPAWEIQTIYTASADRALFDVGLASDAQGVWVIWNDGSLDQTDVHTRIASLSSQDTAAGGITVEDIGSVLDYSSTMPAITVSNGLVYANALTLCDERWSGCADNRQNELLVRASDGTWSEEPIDLDNASLDHGRTNLAWHGDALHACYKVLHAGIIEDEVHCSVRSASGVWGPSLQISGDHEGADDHPTIAIRSDGRRIIGYSRREGDRRRGVLWVEQDPGEGTILTLQVGYGVGEDPLPGIDSDGVVHLIWREEIGDSMVLLYGQCTDACALADSWTFQVLTGGGDLLAPSLAMYGSVVLFTWTHDDVVRTGWRCPDGTFVLSDPDPGTGAQSTHRGQPSISVDWATETMLVSYARLTPLGETEVRLARRALPACGAGGLQTLR